MPESNSLPPGFSEAPKGLWVIDNPLEVIRHRPQAFLTQGLVRDDILASYLADNVLSTCPGATAVMRHGDWWVVASEDDWIKRFREARSIREYFSEIVSFPERGVNCIHAEVVIMAFAEGLFTTTAGDTPVYLLGEMPDQDLIVAVTRSLPHWRRLVAFRLPAAFRMPTASDSERRSSDKD